MATTYSQVFFWPESCNWDFFSLFKTSLFGTSSTMHPCHCVFSFILLPNRHFNLTNRFGMWKVLIFSDLWLVDSRSSRNCFKTNKQNRDKQTKRKLKEIYYIGWWAKEAEFCTDISFPQFTSAVSNTGSFTLLSWLLHLWISLFHRCISTAKHAKIRAVLLALDTIVIKDMILWS